MVKTNKQERLEIETLKNIFCSNLYRTELEDLSCYGAHIKQERPMCYILAKYLYKQGFDIALEKTLGKNQWYDLVVNNTKIEAKFYYESDLRDRLKKEMDESQWNIDSLIHTLDSLKKDGKSYSWKMTLSIIEDILNKNPDLFILIILSHDLRKKRVDVPLDQICWSKYEIKYNKDYGFNNPSSFELLDKFLQYIKMKKNFVSEDIRIDVNTIFPSSYHVYFCDFRMHARATSGSFLGGNKQPAGA